MHALDLSDLCSLGDGEVSYKEWVQIYKAKRGSSSSIPSCRLGKPSPRGLDRPPSAQGGFPKLPPLVGTLSGGQRHKLPSPGMKPPKWSVDTGIDRDPVRKLRIRDNR